MGCHRTDQGADAGVLFDRVRCCISAAVLTCRDAGSPNRDPLARGDEAAAASDLSASVDQ